MTQISVQGADGVIQPETMDAIKQVSLPHRIDYLPLNSVSAPAYHS